MRITFDGTMEEFYQVFGDRVHAEVGSARPAKIARQKNMVPWDVAWEMARAETKKVELPEEKAEEVAEETTVIPLPKLEKEARAEALGYWEEFCTEWLRGFEHPEQEQPDRLKMIQDLGSSRFLVPILIMAYEIGSLQRLIEKGLHNGNPGPDLDFIDRMAANMVQVSHMGAPDLAGTYDYSTKWRRTHV